MDHWDRIAPLRLAAGMLLATLPVSATIALVIELAAGAFSAEGAARLFFTALAFELPFVLLLGLPVALWRLRDRATPLAHWGLAGLVAGLVAGAGIALWLALTGRLAQFFSPPTAFILLLLAVTGVSGVLTAVIGRRIALLLGR